MTPEPPPPPPPASLNNELFDMPGYQPTPDERTWGLIAHLLGIVAGFLGPIIVMATKGNESRWVKTHSVEALNFQLALLIAYLVGFVTSFVFIGFCLIFAAMFGSIILSVIAGVKAYNGGAYRYPVNIRFIKS